ncbi:hypothetical protein [Facilibium subflavum]|uniref:hypothetical protein n=1 Tax=Facilibium subflavum TaxID=2219058 RepID=UPI0013C35816|nr:hypothetical protein [Facilibium subflavum]
MNVIIEFLGTGDEASPSLCKRSDFFTSEEKRCITCQSIVRKGSRHHCRLCGDGYFCDTCAPKRKWLNSARACQECMDNYDYSDSLQHSNYLWLLDDIQGNFRLLINGCQKSDVGGTSFYGASPNLNVISEKIMELIFWRPGSTGCKIHTEEKRMTRILGNAYAGHHLSAKVGRISEDEKSDIEISEIENIILLGFSRGAISCFNFARHLGKCFRTRDIPIYIFADQPVPGNMVNSYRSVLSQHQDLTRLDNIKHCTIILGSYDESEISTLEKHFFKQMVPSFHNDTDLNLLRLPIAQHLQGRNMLKRCFNDFLNLLLDQGINIITDVRLQTLEYYLENYAQPQYPAPHNVQPIYARNIEKERIQYLQYDQQRFKDHWKTSSQNHCVGCNERLYIGLRHHCRLCGDGHFCNTCAPIRADHQNIRVCSQCADV